ncbi:MAG TPA: hypothetical protein VK968_11950 [Roseimicrobium sp.]|nr:hypothetical protein [Roseimicrobium sp.]
MNKRTALHKLAHTLDVGQRKNRQANIRTAVRSASMPRTGSAASTPRLRAAR